MSVEKNVLNAALDYLNKGFTVIPVRKDKKPYISWQEFQNRKPTEQEVRNWWEKYPEANLGVVLSKRHVILDIDNPDLANKIVNAELLLQTRVERSISGGVHIWFETEKEVQTDNFRRDFGVEAEVRAYGTYIIVPPSEGYQLLSDASISKVKNARSKALQLLNLNEMPVSQATSLSVKSDTITKGSRNNDLTSLAGTLFHKGFSKDVVSETLQQVNRRVCVPPVSGSEVESIVSSIDKAESAKTLNADVATLVSSGKYYTLNEILKTKDSKTEWIWEGFIARGFMTLLSSHPKMGKTTLLFNLLRAAKDKKDFLSYPTHLTGKVLILSEENKRLYAKRAEDLGLKGDDLLIMLSFDVYSLSWSDILKKVKEVIEKEQVELLVIDTLGAFWRVSNENEAPAVQAAIDGLKILAQGSNVGVLVLHHLRKAEGSHGVALRGSSALMGAVDNSLEFQSTGVTNRRKITSHSRFDETPSEILVERNKEKNYEYLGAASSFEKEEVKLSFKDALTDAYESLESIRVRMVPQPASSTLQEIAAEVRKETPPTVDYTGSGVKGKPYQYRRLTQKLFAN